MKRLLIGIFTLCMWALCLHAQSGGFNPTNPGDPQPFYILQVQVSPEAGGSVNITRTMLAAGQQVSLYISPNANFRIQQWVCGDEVLSSSTRLYFTMPARNVTITAQMVYEPEDFNPPSPGDPEGQGEVIPQHLVTIYTSPSEGGSTSQSTFYMQEGQTQKLYAYNNTNFDFMGWYKDGQLESTSNPHTITMGDSDIVLTAHFQFNPNSPSDPPSEIPDPDDDVHAYIVPAAIFSNWEDDNIVQVKLTDISGKVMTYDMTPEEATLYVASITPPKKRITSIIFVQNGNSGETVEQIEALDGAQTYNGTWHDCVFARLGDVKYWFPLSTKEVSIAGGIVVYYDNSTTQWGNVYLRGGRNLMHGYGSDWSQSLQMTHVDNTEIWYVYIEDPIADIEYWTITDSEGENGDGYSFYAIPSTANILRPSSRSITSDTWISVNAYNTPQTYLIWNSWTYSYQNYVAPKYYLRNIPDTLHEGEIAHIEVYSEVPYNYNRTFQLIPINKDNRLQISPQKLTMPAMETSGEFVLSLQDDNAPQQNILPISFYLYENTAGYFQSKDTTWLVDNDLPAITLELSHSSINEGAGISSFIATVKRQTLPNSKITIYLSDNSNGRIFYENPYVTLESGQLEAAVRLGIIEDTQAQGDETITISAAVYIPSCYCAVEETTVGFSSQSLLIEDNDVPTLSLSISDNMLLEGKEEAVWLTVSRNTPTDTALTVALSVDHPDGLIFPNTIVIQPGNDHERVKIYVRRNEQSDDSHSVAFMATHEGFIYGSCYAMVVDQTLPDALVEIKHVDLESAEINQEVFMTIAVSNHGAAGLAKGVQVALYATYSNTPLSTFSLPSTIKIDSVYEFRMSVITPSRVGTYTYFAEVNWDSQVKELFYYNNESSRVQITVTPPFKVTALNVDKSSYMPGDTVHISGHASGSLAANTEVEIYAINQGWRTTFNVTTDANGDFQGQYVPLQGQTGRFSLGACYPSENGQEEMASALFYGIEPSRQPVTCQVVLGYPHEGAVQLTNTGAFPIHAVTASLAENMPDGTVTFGTVDVINPGEIGLIPFVMECSSATIGNDWKKIAVNITSEEALTASIPLYYYCQNPQGNLICSIEEIRTNISARDTSIIMFYLGNTGLGGTGEISLALPAWMQSLTPAKIPSIANGESAQVVLRTIPNDMFVDNLNAPINGQIGVNPTNCNGFALPFTVTPVSNQYGTLRVDVCDENTYYTEAGPHVENAEVVIKNVSTGAVIYRGLTNEQGIYEIALTEGYYGIYVSAENHDAYSNNVFVQPDNITTTVVNLSIRAIEITWTVEETEVEDSYEIITTVVYETQVPKPVVVIEAPSRIPGDSLQEGESLMYTIKATNKGLIRAEDVTITLPDGGGNFVFEALAYQNPFNLEAKQSVEIPVKVTRIENPNYAPSRDSKYHGIIECNGNMITLYYWDCGTDRKYHQYGVPINYAHCDDWHMPISIDNTGGGPGWGGLNWWLWGPISGPTGRVNGPYESSEDPPGPIVIDEGCEPCGNELITKMVQCGVSYIPVVGDVVGAAQWINNCVRDIITMVVEPSELMDAAIDCLSETGKYWLGKNKIAQAILCLIDFYAPCEHTAENAASAPSRVRASNGIEDEYANEPEYMARFKRRLKIAVEAATSYQNYIDMYVNPEIQEYISNAEMVDLFYAWDLAMKGEMDENMLNTYRPAALPDNLWADLLTRMNNTYQYKNGNTSITSNYINPEEVAACLLKINECAQSAEALGYASLKEMLEHEHELLEERLNNKSANVCATITLQFEQKMTMTRQAFRGTLSVFNGHENTAMTDMHLKLDIYDELGRKATDKEFQINLEKLDGMSGELQLETEDGWTINAKETGVATILFIPTKFAAPTQDIVYSFGGELSYTDPFSGLTVTRQLFPVQLTVSPSPQLELTYFMQRDVYSDDPLTETIVEPTQPTEFALLINNIGYGDAKNVRMTTKEPQIVDNEKGLLIDFYLLHALLNGTEKSLPMNEQIATEFGTIPAHSQMYAQWFFASTLLGHFIEYDVAYTHLSSYDNPNLSLIDTVHIHEMIHSISVPSSGPTHVGWLVNDEADAADTPDALYVSDGSKQTLHIASSMQLSQVDKKTCIATCVPSTGGWNYGVVEAPMFRWRDVVRVTRLSDNAEISSNNVWQTYCILTDGADPIHINRLHLADNIENATSYRIEFSDRLLPDTVGIYRLSYLVDGEEYAFDSLEYYMPITLLPEPIKEGHTFGGWQQVINIMPAHNDTIYGNFIPNQYPVTFLNYNGVELQSSDWYYGTEPAYSGSDPVKPATVQYTYLFTGWSPEVVTVTGNAVYTAQYDSIVNQYRVTYVNYNGVELQSSDWYYGTEPAYSGSDPVKPATVQYTYLFTGWSPEVVTVTGDAVYTAQYDSIVNQYLIIFMDEDSTILCSEEWEYGTIPFCESPEKQEDEYYWYSFERWNPEVQMVTEPAVYVAIYTAIQKQGTTLDNVSTIDCPQKILIGNQVFILRAGKTYTITGQEVK